MLYNIIEKIRTFELSKKLSVVILFVILGIYVGFSIPELFIDESTQLGDYRILKEGLELWPFGKSGDVYVQEQIDRYVRMFLLDISYDVFQNVKLLPFLASILVVFFTYLIAIQFCKKRFAGIISIVVLLQSYLFLKFDTIAVYENFWVLFLSNFIICNTEKMVFISPFLHSCIFHKSVCGTILLDDVIYCI